MSDPKQLDHFVTVFFEPIISQDQKMALLRCQYEDGSKGCIGIRGEAFETFYFDPKKPAPFVTKFLEPIIAQDQKMALLRCQYEDGSTGCIGIRGEAFDALYMAFKSFLERNEDIDNTQIEQSNLLARGLKCALTTQPMT